MSISKNKLNSAKKLIEKGAILLKEPCSKCGSLQINYRNQILCLNCNDLTNLDTSITKNVISNDLNKQLGDKIQKLITLLINENDYDNEIKLITLIKSYIELYDKIYTFVEKNKR